MNAAFSFVPEDLSMCRWKMNVRGILRSNIIVDHICRCVPPVGQTIHHWSKHSSSVLTIGLYRDVWIAASASSRTRLATLTGAMCKTSQCELRSIRVNSGMLNVIRIVTYYTLPPLESPTSSWMAMAFWR